MKTLALISDAPGAWPKGSRVMKVIREPGDTHGPGDMATVLGSIGPMPPGKDIPAWMVGLYCYCVAWDDMPDIPVFVTNNKITVAT